MPVRAKKETLRAYVQRCMPIRRHEHPKEPKKKTIAACYSMGRTHWKPKK